MTNQKDLVHNYPWNTIYIMDAMRYDVFKEIIDEDNISLSSVKQSPHTMHGRKAATP